MDDDALTRQIRALERDLADCKRELDALRRTQGYVDDRLTRVESHVHRKVGRSELFSIAMALIPMIVAGALILSLLVSSRPHASP
jgi:hypothetical protein